VSERSSAAIEAPLLRFGGRNFLRVSCQVYNRAIDYARLAATIELIAADMAS